MSETPSRIAFSYQRVSNRKQAGEGKKGIARQGEEFAPFCERHGLTPNPDPIVFSVRAHGIVKDDTLIAAAMGHTVEVHHRSYRTTEWRSVRAAFAPASQSKQPKSLSQQQMQQQQ